LRSVVELDRTERRVLEQLNAGGSPDASVTRAELEKLIEAGLVSESELGTIQITPRGQLALARWRFRNLPQPRYVVFGHAKPRYNLWQRLFR
jgi:hypothetical protein